ncbi:hypothetical protein B9M84_08615, partial [Mycobacteroides abscessus]
ASDPDDVVAELAGVGPCHGDILPARPCWASQLRCHLFVQQTRGGVDVSASIAEVMARRDEVLRSRGIEPNGQGTCK